MKRSLKKRILATSDSDVPDADQERHEKYNYDQDENMMSGHSGMQVTKKETEMNTSRHSPGGHERETTTKLQNMEKNKENMDTDKRSRKENTATAGTGNAKTRKPIKEKWILGKKIENNEPHVK